MADTQTSLTFGDAFDIATDDKFRTDLLGWLTWLPLQRAEELARCSGASRTVVYEALAYHEHIRALNHVTLAEPGVRSHRRYYITDAGLYAFAERHDPPYNVASLVQAYPVRERDLLELILHQETMILLNDLASRIVEEGRTLGYRIVSLQNPSYLVYRDRERKHTFTSDASIILQLEKNGGKHAFFVQIDGCEYTDARATQQRLWLANLLSARDALFWQRTSLPSPLIVTTPDRLATWATLLFQAHQEQRVRLPLGAITVSVKMDEGVFSPIWWTFSTLAEWGKRSARHIVGGAPPSERVGITQLFEEKATTQTQFPGEIEQRRIEQTLHRTPRRGAAPSRDRHLAKHVQGTFMESAQNLTPTHLLPDQLLDADPLQTFAHLTLRLSAQEKTTLSLLARHPLLSGSDLAALVTPEATGTRTIGEYLTNLARMGLVCRHHWDKGATADMQMRYKLTESALRFLAERYNLSPLHYLTQRTTKEKDGKIAVQKTEWVQRGVPGLEAQMEHTVGVYRCMVGATRQAQEKADHTILSWKSAYEAVQWYQVPLAHTRSQLRPDGEICYRDHVSSQTVIALLEYDRATTRRRDYEKKFSSYSNYILAAGQPLPPILIVTQNIRTAQMILSTVHDINPRISIITILEDDLLSNGLALCIRKNG